MFDEFHYPLRAFTRVATFAVLVAIALAGCSFGAGDGPVAPTATRGRELRPTALPSASRTAIPDAYPAYPSTFDTPEPSPSPRAYPVLPTLTPSPRPSATPQLPTPTPLPELFLQDLTADQIPAMAVWQETSNDRPFSMYQISQTPLGVTAVSWAPDGQHLVIELATSEVTMWYVITTPIIVARNGAGSAWGTLGWGNMPCTHSYEWSPDGSRLVYTTGDQLLIAGGTGEGELILPVPGGSEGISSPRYSPDGSRIAVRSLRTVDNYALYDVWAYEVAAGTPSLLIEDGGFGAFTWSPGGDALAHLGEDSGPPDYSDAARLWIAGLNGGPAVSIELDTLPGTDGCLEAPQWVENGERIVAVVLGRPHIWLVDHTGSATQLPPPTAGATETYRASYLGALISPDGNYVLYSPDGASAQLLDLKADHLVPLPSFAIQGANWSPVAPQFLYTEPDSYESPLLLVDARDGSVRELDDIGLWPSWSPDGGRIAYWKPEDGGFALWLMEIGGEPVRLATHADTNAQREFGRLYFHNYRYETTPQWSPDGTAIAFVAWQGVHPEAYVVEIE